MQNKKGKGKLKKIVAVLIVAALLSAIFVVNIFFPVKYTFAYFTSRKYRSAEGEAYVRFLNVGYGDAAVVQLPDGKTLLVDCGDGAYGNNYRIIRALNRCGISDIDYAVCTSVSKEHCGGFADVLSVKGVQTVFCPYVTDARITDSYHAFRKAAAGRAEIKYTEYNLSVAEESYFFTFLSPTSHQSPLSEYEDMRRNPTEENIANASAVLWLSIYGINFFFAGDIYADKADKIVEESRLIQPYCPVNGVGIDLSGCHVLKVPNHGSDKSLSTRLYDALQPEYAVISVGTNSRGCPASAVITNAGNTASTYLTSEYGDVVFKITPEGYSVN